MTESADSTTAGPGLKEGLLQLTAHAKQFVGANLPDLAAELLSWRRTGLLTGVRFNELAAMCALYSGDHDEYQVAEYLVQVAALHIAASSSVDTSAVRNSTAKASGS